MNQVISNAKNISIDDAENELNNLGRKRVSNFGLLIRALRQKLGISQNDLAMSLEHSGYPIDISSISYYETGKRKPPASIVAHLSIALKLSTEQETLLLQAYIQEIYMSALEDYKEAKEKIRSVKNGSFNDSTLKQHSFSNHMRGNSYD